MRKIHEANRKFEVSKEDLEKLLATKPLTYIGKMFGVTGNVIKKRARLLGIVLISKPYKRKNK